MAEQDQTNDQDIYAAVDKVIKHLLPFDPYGRLRVYRTVGTFFGFDESFPQITAGAAGVDGRVPADVSREPEFSRSEEPTPKVFLLEKRPNTDVERAACLAYYLARYRNKPHFKTTDISKLNTEAAQIKLSNASYTVNNAVSAGYLAIAAKGMKQLSAHGEQLVEALPDRDAAKAIKPRGKSRRPRRNGRGPSR